MKCARLIATLVSIFWILVCLPVTGLSPEPGDLRLCNEDLGIILWGPDTAPTLSIGKSDVWDRRNPAPPEPILTLKDIIQRAYAGEQSILNGAAYYSAYNSHDFPCPKPVGQLILSLPFVAAGGTVSATEIPHALHLIARNGAKTSPARSSGS